MAALSMTFRTLLQACLEKLQKSAKLDNGC